MTLYAGEKVHLRIRAKDGHTREIIKDARCVINLYGPPKQPKTNPDDRVPDHVVGAVYDPVSRYYLATVSTKGWAPGQWWMQGVITGGAADYDAWDYDSFPLAA